MDVNAGTAPLHTIFSSHWIYPVAFPALEESDESLIWMILDRVSTGIAHQSLFTAEVEAGYSEREL
jgi:hypothetical protein